MALFFSCTFVMVFFKTGVQITVTNVIQFKKESMKSDRRRLLNDSQMIELEFQRDPPSRSARNQKMGREMLHELKLIENYLKIHKPILSEARRDIIEKKLELEKQAEKLSVDRIKNDDCFVRFDYNPLTDQENIRINRSLSAVSLKKGAARKGEEYEEEGRLNLLNVVHKPKKHNLQRHAKQLRQIGRDAQNQSSKVKYSVSKTNFDFQGRQSTHEQSSTKEHRVSFDDIITLPDKNYYSDKQKDINIFEFMLGNTNKILTKQVLTKYHFSFTSSVEKMNKYKFPIYRDLSRQGRSFAYLTNLPKNVRLDALNSKELSFTLKDIRFIDLISVASGRVDSSLAYSILFQGNAQKDNSPNSSVIDEEEIVYQDNQRLKSMNFNKQQNIRQENIDYLNLENQPIEEKYAQKYKKVNRNVEHNLIEIKKIYGHTIRDKKLHQQYEALIANDLQYLVNLDTKSGFVLPAESDKNIRSNKVNKNRQQRLKIKQLLNTIQLKNQYQQKINELLADRPTPI